MPLAPYGRSYSAKRTWQGSTGPAAIDQLWVALATVEVVDTSIAETITEVAAASYVRKALPLSAANTTIGDTGEGVINGAVVWPLVVEETWGTIVAFALMTTEAIGTGELFAYGTIPATTPIAGDAPTIPASTLAFSITG